MSSAASAAADGPAAPRAQVSFVMAMTIDIRMRTTRMDCIQIQVGDMPTFKRLRAWREAWRAGTPAQRTMRLAAAPDQYW